MVYAVQMDSAVLIGGLGPAHLILACGIALLAGFVKGAIGFAMPMILVSGLGSFLSPELALAGLILPTVVTNALQALRGGTGAAWRAIGAYRIYLGVGAVCLVASAQLVRSIDEHVLFALIGIPIMGFGLVQLMGIRPRADLRHRSAAEVLLGVVSGFVGGISGVWGPPLVMYLTVTGTPKREQVQILGVAFGLGALLLLATHLQTGVLNRSSLPFSAVLTLPALAGMWLGQGIQDRMDQGSFRRLTLVVLIIAGLNLLRRALT